MVKQAAIVALMTWLSIELHELGHWVVYALAGYPERLSFQRVSPLGVVPAGIDHWAKLAGPVVSLLAATAC